MGRSLESFENCGDFEKLGKKKALENFLGLENVWILNLLDLADSVCVSFTVSHTATHTRTHAVCNVTN